MTTRLRALLFVLVAALMQFAVVDLRHEGRVETVVLAPGAFADATLKSERPLRALLRDVASAERGSQKTRADDAPAALPATVAEIERAEAGLLAPAPRLAAAYAPAAARAHRPRGPPAAEPGRPSLLHAPS